MKIGNFELDLQRFRVLGVFLACYGFLHVISYFAVVSCLWQCIGKLVAASLVASLLCSGIVPHLDGYLDRIFGAKADPVDGKNKAVFITGCDTGFGYELAMRLHQLGFHVFAGCLTPEYNGAEELRLFSLKNPRLHVLKCDVTSQEDVLNCAVEVQETVDSQKLSLWAVVNNAGIASFSEFEWMPTTLFQKILDVNAVGGVRICKAFLPLLRKSPQGRIVFVASLSGRYVIPGFTAYSMSKFATVALADGLRGELAKFNIPVTTVEPSFYKTNMASSSLVAKDLDQQWSLVVDDVRKSYGQEYFETFKAHVSKLTSDARTNVGEAVDSIVEAVVSPQPNARYIPNPIVRIRGTLIPYLPYPIQSFILGKYSAKFPAAQIPD